MQGLGRNALPLSVLCRCGGGVAAALPTAVEAACLPLYFGGAPALRTRLSPPDRRPTRHSSDFLIKPPRSPTRPRGTRSCDEAPIARGLPDGRPPSLYADAGPTLCSDRRGSGLVLRARGAACGRTTTIRGPVAAARQMARFVTHQDAAPRAGGSGSVAARLRSGSSRGARPRRRRCRSLGVLRIPSSGSKRPVSPALTTARSIAPPGTSTTRHCRERLAIPALPATATGSSVG